MLLHYFWLITSIDAWTVPAAEVLDPALLSAPRGKSHYREKPAAAAREPDRRLRNATRFMGKSVFDYIVG